MKNAKKKISLEEYIDFVQSHKQTDLTVNLLNQIISMHGFKKMHNVAKKVVTDAINTIDLIHPSRSTLKEITSSCAFITLEDIMTDLDDLNWKECCVTSIQTLNMSKEKFSAEEITLHSAENSRPKLRSKGSKSRGLRKLQDANGVDCSNSDLEIGEPMENLVSKRKRKSNAVKALAGVDGDHGSSSSALVSQGSS